MEEWKSVKRISPLDLLETVDYLNIQAPMVRYSKLPFRALVRNYNVHLTYTPMLLSDVFAKSSVARDLEFQTNLQDTPVMVQFAANNGKDLADAAELVAPYSNGVDLNCGCPQKWAYQEGIGSYLMEKPVLVADMVDQVKRRTAPMNFQSKSGTGYPCSIKIRINKDIKDTIDMVQRAEKMGVDWITVHGRLRTQRSTEPVDYEAIKLIKESVNIPVFANGDVFSKADADRIVAETGVDGVMAARGLLENPALFAGYEKTPMECVRKYVEYGIGYGATHFIFHHHLSFMLETSMSKYEKKHFNLLTSVPGILDYMDDHWDLQF